MTWAFCICMLSVLFRFRDLERLCHHKHIASGRSGLSRAGGRGRKEREARSAKKRERREAMEAMEAG
jgi:hypothetical protein